MKATRLAPNPCSGATAAILGAGIYNRKSGKKRWLPTFIAMEAIAIPITDDC
jgi:hypothetical protein